MKEFYLQHEPTYNKYYIRRSATGISIAEYYIIKDEIVFWYGIGETVCYKLSQLREIMVLIAAVSQK